MPLSPETPWPLTHSEVLRKQAPEKRLRLEEEVVGLFDQLREPLLRYLIGLGLAPEDGQEIVQETFLALFQHLVRGKPRTNLRAWLFRVAHNLALKRRHAARRNQGLDADDLFVDAGPTPEDQAVDRQRHRRLAAVLEGLERQDRRCLLLRAEGLRYREIAEILDISLGSVALSLSRSLARITRVIER